MVKYFQKAERNMQIQTVFFDMGGTVDTYWYSPEMRLALTPELQSYLCSKGLNLGLTDLQLYELVTGGLASYHQWRLRTLEELPPSLVWRDYILADYPQDFPQLDAIADDLMVWIETRYYHRQMRPEMPSVLSAIKNMGYKIGLISNVNSRGQVHLNLSQYGIKHFFNPIVLSSEYERRKPDPAIFHHAARLSNTPTSECIYIGDRINRDILGAKRAGFKLAIQIKHDFKHGEVDEGATPDMVLDNMNELLDILRGEYLSHHSSLIEKPPSSKVRAVLFDADGVLYYRKNKDKELNSFIKRYGVPCKDNLDSEINQLRHRAFIGRLSFEQYKTAVLSLYSITDPALVSKGLQTALQEKNRILFFKDTLDTLKVLKARLLYLGIITDTAQPLYVKLSKLERGGFGHLWDSITPSNEVGVQKPHPEIYRLAMEQLGVAPEQSVFVGHKSIELDGARNVGIKTVAFNYDPDAKADFYIHDFSELASLPVLN
jgi:putative hydrolase of the HAD superfamily